MQKYIKEIAIKNNIDEDVVTKIVRSQFEFVREAISSGDFRSIRLHHLGVFTVKPRQLDKYMSFLADDSNIIEPNTDTNNVD